ncbi:hypothetical protein ANCDUO_05676 [Ancylostoma duodenale]|uniref:Uncharacterized protein n=1 Tax=Ancylostoma duodenale TaxID=51022 RepID=A0A0C2H3L0_9BILA|nr:hypothetical protein ANCDUO_05676 [Ancylostoma duodenale]
MTTFDPLLNTEELHTELLKTVDHKLLDTEELPTELLKTVDHKYKLDVLHLKFEEFASTVTARLENQLTSRLDAIHNTLAVFQNLDTIHTHLMERTTPKSQCVFCPLEDNIDLHHSARCPRFLKSYSRTFEASRIGLCDIAVFSSLRVERKR